MIHDTSQKLGLAAAQFAKIKSYVIEILQGTVCQ